MTGSSSTQPNDSSAPLLKGMPEFVGYFQAVISNYHSALSAAIDQIAEDEQAMVRDKARQSDTGWASLADKIKVQYAPEERMLKYSVDTSDLEESNKVQTLEFGDEENAPSPLLRVAAHRGKETFGPRVNSKAYDLLAGTF